MKLLLGIALGLSLALLVHFTATQGMGLAVNLLAGFVCGCIGMRTVEALYS